MICQTFTEAATEILNELAQVTPRSTAKIEALQARAVSLLDQAGLRTAPHQAETAEE